MMILNVKDKEYKVKFGYNSFCDTDLMERTSDLLNLFNGADVEDDKDEKTAPAKTNGACGDCSKCVKTDTDGDKKQRKLADSGYYSSAYVNLNGKEFYSEGADSWNDVKKAVREYFDNKKID